MNIEEAYQAMLQGNQVAHESYDKDEFNWMEYNQIHDENGYYWGLKGDEPWNMRVENDWFKEGWVICNDRKKRKKYR